MVTNEPQGLTQRHWIALTALVAGIVALYLYLWKLGLMGALSCSATHGCETVQTDPTYGFFLGAPVALFGVVGYLLILITALIGTSEKYVNDRRITIALMCLIYPAILFTLRLKYYEFFVLNSFCIWCAESAVTILLQGVLVYFDMRRVTRAAS